MSRGPSPRIVFGRNTAPESRQTNDRIRATPTERAANSAGTVRPLHELESIRDTSRCHRVWKACFSSDALGCRCPCAEKSSLPSSRPGNASPPDQPIQVVFPDTGSGPVIIPQSANPIPASARVRGACSDVAWGTCPAPGMQSGQALRHKDPSKNSARDRNALLHCL